MFKHLAAAAAFAVVACSASANPNRYMYAGAEAGSSDMGDYLERGTSVGAFLGYRFNPNIAIEGSFRRLGKFEQAGSTRSVVLNQYAFSVIGSVPLAQKLSVFGRAGLNVHDADQPRYGVDSDSKTFSALLGAGLQYDFTPSVAGRVEFQRTGSHVSTVSAGVAFKF